MAHREERVAVFTDELNTKWDELRQKFNDITISYDDEFDAIERNILARLRAENTTESDNKLHELAQAEAKTTRIGEDYSDYRHIFIVKLGYIKILLRLKWNPDLTEITEEPIKPNIRDLPKGTYYADLPYNREISSYHNHIATKKGLPEMMKDILGNIDLEGKSEKLVQSILDMQDFIYLVESLQNHRLGKKSEYRRG